MQAADEFWERLLRSPPADDEVLLAPAPGGAAFSGAEAERASASPPQRTVDRRHTSQLTYEQFVGEYMAPNLPVLIEGVAEGWRSFREWVLPSDGSPDLDFLEEHFGSATLCVTDTASVADGAEDGSGPLEMSLADYLAWWRENVPAAGAAPGGGGGGGAAPWLYLKDWHFAAEFPEYQAYTCPPFFSDDWLNEWHDAKAAAGGAGAAGAAGTAAADPNTTSATSSDSTPVACSDYRFLYLGPPGTRTGLHSDVLRSFSWSANVAGRKRWRLLPPQYSYLLRDRHGRGCAPDFGHARSSGDGGDGASGSTEEAEYPGLAEARRQVVEVVQGPGAALFVPSGWHHTVDNLEATLSVNHNWINGCGVHRSWALLARERGEAAAAIEDCRELCSPAEFEGLVQRNLAANAGLSFPGFGDLLRFIAGASLAALLPPGEAAECSSGRSRLEHALRLQRAGQVLRGMASLERRLLAEAGGGGERREDGGGDAGQFDPHPLAGEADLNEACLARIAAALGALGLGDVAPGGPLDAG